MQVTQRGRRYTVLDDFLDGPALAEIRRVMTHSTFAPAQGPIQKAEDGTPYKSRTTVVRNGTSDRRTAGGPDTYDRVLDVITAAPALFGDLGSDWDRVGFTFWKYPVGSRYGWHSDAGGGRTGAYILFLHDEWRASWGGELLILDEGVGEPGESTDTAEVGAAVQRSALSPVAVLPRPNRLVLLSAGTPHQVNRVDPTAVRERCTLTGFVTRRSDGAGAEARDGLRRFLTSLEGAPAQPGVHSGTSGPGD
ncbi:2OG-Fe(II) oxygenase [Streptacidiphilus sp. PB12-B1b]|uniref:2OG-Fe(II) oxygenase n=1 Tax=Streptacidiphilus sp. PB12-B1b TaxID=2705012 RepID=UPI0015FDC2A4|nr:2OG-Fe(II) oxygenase [Streptacidiphilus sp. PB12-B1b]QMU74630.1 2OG-Fe(II) oxygenase [Streptacidiphilus sp. PB12-B1b]